MTFLFPPTETTENNRCRCFLTHWDMWRTLLLLSQWQKTSRSKSIWLNPFNRGATIELNSGAIGCMSWNVTHPWPAKSGFSTTDSGEKSEAAVRIYAFIQQKTFTPATCVLRHNAALEAPQDRKAGWGELWIWWIPKAGSLLFSETGWTCTYAFSFAL